MNRNRFISSGIFIVLYSIGGKLLAFIKDAVISSLFGRGDTTDAYFLASNIPSLFYLGFFATIALVFLPAYNNVKARKNETLTKSFVNASAAFYAFSSMLFTIGLWIFAEEAVSKISPGISELVAKNAAYLLRIGSISFSFNALAAVLTSVQISNKKIHGFQLIPLINNGILIAFIALTHNSLGIQSAVIGALLGWILQLPIQLHLTKEIYKPSFNFKNTIPDLKIMIALMPAAFIGVSIDQLNVLIDNFFASSMESGSISALNFGLRLSNVNAGILLMIVSTLIYPLFSELSSEKRQNELLEKLNHSIRILTLIAIPLSITAALGTRQIVSLVYQRGQFGANDVEPTALIFACYSIGLVFVVLREVLNRYFFSRSMGNVAMWSSVVAIAINFFLSKYLSQIYGTLGLATATTISISVAVIFQLLYCKLKFGRQLTKGWLKFGCKLFSISGLISILGYYFTKQIDLNSTPLINLLSLFGLVLVSFLALSKLFRITELESFILFFKQKLASLKSFN